MLKVFSWAVQGYLLGDMLWKGFFTSSGSASGLDFPTIWSYSPVPAKDLCWLNTAVYQDPRKDEPTTKDVSSNTCIESCFDQESDCRAVTYHQPNSPMPSQCFHMSGLNPNHLQTQPPFPEPAVMTVYECADYRTSSTQTLLNETGCFDYTGEQVADKSCLNCPGMQPGKMCVNEDIHPATCPPSVKCESLANCPYLSEECPKACTDADEGNYWVDRIEAVRNLAYIGCYPKDGNPPGQNCINGKCSDSKYTDKKSCQANNHVWCSACPYQQVCGLCDEDGNCPDSNLNKIKTCYDLQCTCDPTEVIDGTCGAVMNSSICESNGDNVWRNAMDVAGRCIPSMCWVDGIPDPSFTDSMFCTKQAHAEWIEKNTDDMEGCPELDDHGGGGGNEDSKVAGLPAWAFAVIIIVSVGIVAAIIYVATKKK